MGKHQECRKNDGPKLPQDVIVNEHSEKEAKYEQWQVDVGE